MRNRKRALIGLSILLCIAAAVIVQRTMLADTPPSRISYIPAETDDVLNNPYMGFAVSARSEEEFEQPFRLAYANLMWSELEPEQGKIDFEAIERIIRYDYWRGKGVKLIIRVVLDYPRDEAHMDIPEWLYEEIGGKGTKYDNEYGKGFSPDYSNPVLIRAHESLIRRLAERYNDDPEIAFVALGSVGHWGEWHTYDGTRSAVIPFPKHAITDQYVQPYLTSFDDKLLMMRRPHAIAKENGMGLFNDAFGRRDSTLEEFRDWYLNGYENWLTGEQEPAMPDFWTVAPSGGEFAGGADLSDDQIEEAILEARMTHVSWLGPNAPYDEPTGSSIQSNIDRFLNTIGYRFAVAEESHEREAKPGDTLHVELRINNRGVAPFYFEWPLELSLSDAEGRIAAAVRTGADIRKWLPGTSDVLADLPVPDDLTEGIYTVNVAILDPESGNPAVDWAMEGKRADGRYSLGEVEIRR